MMSPEIHDYVVNLCDNLLDDGAAQHLVNRLYKRRKISPQQLEDPLKLGDYVFIKRDEKRKLYVVEEVRSKRTYPYKLRHAKSGETKPEPFKASELERVE